MNLGKKLRKIISILAISGLLLTGSPIVYGFEPPTPPSAPTLPPEPTPPPAPTYEEPAPTPPPAPSWEDPDSTPSPEQVPEESQGGETSSISGEESLDSEASGSSGGSGVVGDVTVSTGDATNTATIANDVNSNLSATQGGGGATIVNSGNGLDSTNSGSATIVNDDTTVQNNSASVVNDLAQSSTTGENSASRNVGNSTIYTGDANTTGTIVNAVNTNVDGVAVAEFNVVEDHIGDIILDFSTGCLIGCASGDFSVVNSGNGEDSTNSGDITSVTNDTTFQNNDATIENNMTLSADSGTNVADSNTNGDSLIDTGDANVSANLLTFANNNIEGNVVYAVVNIFGDLVGDIILPELSTIFGCCQADSSIANSGNGSESVNSGSINQTTNDTTYQFNNVELENNLILDATSGANDVSGNTGGNSTVTTGDTSVNAQILNIANNNIVGGNFWLVIVNEAGRWIGRILGAPEGSALAGSSEFEFIVNEFGEITVVNSGNGEGSTNTGSVNSVTNNTLVQTNNATITNNLNLSANTGGNSASRNTGGDSTIRTGDANIIANIVNFVNNNISGGGKLLVTVVNVFGTWLGNFVGPGQQPEEQGLGGAPAAEQATNQTSGGQSSGGSSGESSGSSSAAESQTSQAQSSGGLAGVLGIGSGTGENQVPSLSIPLPTGTAAGKKTVDINLAWLLAAVLPVGVVTTAIRRRKVIIKILTFLF